MSANKITIFATEKYLVLSLWFNDKQIHTLSKKLTNNFLESYFPAWNELITSSHFNWKSIKAIYVLNGPGKFAILRCLITNLKLLKLFQPNCQIYTLNHLQFQVPNQNLTISLITANKQHYYFGLYENLKLSQPFQLVAKNALSDLKKRYKNAKLVIDYENADFEKLWKKHFPFFELISKLDNLKPFYLNPFTIDKIK